MHTKQEIIAMRQEGKGLLKQGTFWTDEDISMLKIGYMEGDTITDIALNRGRSEPAVLNKLRQLKMLPVKPKKRGVRKPDTSNNQ